MARRNDEWLKHQTFKLYRERKFTMRQVAQSLDISLASAHKYIHLADYSTEASELTELADKCKGKPFFCPDGSKHVLGQCDRCFWGIIKEPLDRNGQPTPVFDYEQELLNVIDKYHSVAVLKSRSVGVTQLLVLFILYNILALQKEGNYLIVCGNDFEAARGLMRRVKFVLNLHGVVSATRETVCDFPNLKARIQAYPSSVDSLRSWDNVRLIFAEEVDSLEHSQDIRSVLETYRVKSGADLVLVSTPGRLNPTMHKIYKEQEDKCFYYRMQIPYQRSLGKLLDEKDIERLKASSPSFSSEFECKFGAIKVGNVFTKKSINDALSIKYSIAETADNPDAVTSMGIDFGSTGNTQYGGGFAVVVTAYEDAIVKVLEAKLWTNAEYFEVLDDIRNMIRVYNPVKIYLDGSAVASARSLKSTPEVNEDPNYQALIKMYNDDDESPGKSSFITTIERRRRRRRYGDLNDEDRDDLARYSGSSGEGVSKVDEQTFYYQDGSWH